MNKKIVVPYFPSGMKFITPFVFGGGIYLLYAGYYIFGAIVILIGALILTTNYVTEINLKDKYCKDYLSLLGLGVNAELKKFNGLDRIIVTKGNYAQTINTRVQSRQMDWSDYTATLVFDNQETLDLLTHIEKQELLKGLKEFTGFLNVDVEDNTTREPYWIDMTKIN